jgi:putative transcriptional regulator
MSKAFEKILMGLKQAIAHAKGNDDGEITHRPKDFDVAAIREHSGLTSVEFAAKFCISLCTLRHWERGDRKPYGPALALLDMVAKEPKAVLRAMGQGIFKS